MVKVIRPAWSRQLHALLHLAAGGRLIHLSDAMGRVGYAHKDGRYLPYEEYAEFGALLRPEYVVLKFVTWDVKRVAVEPSGCDLLAKWDLAHPDFAAFLRRKSAEAEALRGVTAAG